MVDCGSCHELHNASGDNTTYSQNPDTLAWDYNLHYLRANPNKYVASALSSDLVAHTDINSDDWAFEGGVAYQGTTIKRLTRTKRVHAHDEHGARLGDTVRVMETRPLSKLKRWRVVEIVTRAE